MQVILKSDVTGLGRRGDIVTVAPGYYRNYLLPKGLGYKATAGAEAEAEAMRRVSALRDAESRADAEEIATALVPKVFSIAARTDAGGHLYGSVGVSDIAAAIDEQAGVSIDRKVLQLDSPLKTLGTHMVTALIHDEVQFPITVEITSLDD